jgi:hypothetical protein
VLRSRKEERCEAEEEQARGQAVQARFEETQRGGVGSDEGCADRGTEARDECEQCRANDGDQQSSGEPVDATLCQREQRLEAAFGFFVARGGELAAVVLSPSAVRDAPLTYTTNADAKIDARRKNISSRDSKARSVHVRRVRDGYIGESTPGHAGTLPGPRSRLICRTHAMHLGLPPRSLPRIARQVAAKSPPPLEVPCRWRSRRRT